MRSPSVLPIPDRYGCAGHGVLPTKNRAFGSIQTAEWGPYEVFREQWSKRRSPFVGQHLVEVAHDHAAGVFSGTDDVIERITGQKPMGLEEFIRKHRQAFE